LSTGSDSPVTSTRRGSTRRRRSALRLDLQREAKDDERGDDGDDVEVHLGVLLGREDPGVEDCEQ
jgi:hypothetical protein